MKAYQINRYGSVSGIVSKDIEQPKPGPREALVRIHARAINYRDILILNRQYLLPGAENIVPLSDGAGDIVEVGERVRRVKVGERVAATYFPRWRGGLLEPEFATEQFGCTLNGMLAEFVLVDEEALVKLPNHLSYEEAATLPCAGVTAWSAITGGRCLIPGQTVLTIGTGGVALFALQFAKLFGARVFSITSSAAKVDLLKDLGADVAINSTQRPDWPLALRELTNGRGMDRVVETGGIDSLLKSLASCGWNADVALVLALPAGAIEATAFRGLVVTMRRLFVGSRAAFEEMNRALETHGLRPKIGRVFPFDAANEAYEYFAGKRHIGKVVITNHAA